jgi:DNA-binding transcriptional LysR family regulator
MDIHRIDLNLLVVLEAIYTEGGLTRAAERLSVTQPAISYALGRLRDLLGDPLFVREGHTMVPTPFTRNMIEPLRRALRSVESTLNDMKRFDPAVAERRFTLGCRDSLESRVLPRLMNRISRQAPRVELATVHFSRRDVKADLASGRLDVVTDVVLPMSRHIHRQRLNDDRLAVVARRGHPEIQGALTLDEYLGQKHILVSSRPTGPGAEDFELGRHGLQRRVVLRCRHYFAALRVVAETDLVVTMPQRMAQVVNQHMDNQILPFPIEVPSHDTYLLWHANLDNDPANRWLREQIIWAFSGE